MEDDKLITIFSNFEPEISSDSQFMGKLQQNVALVDIIRQNAADYRSKNKKALIIAAFIGFVVGIVFSILLPYLSAAVSNWQLTLPSESLLNAFAENFTIVAWLVIGCTSVLAAINTYEVSLYLLKSKEKSTY